ncbi:MAG: response regulator [Kiloniellales bacterium]|nr:response regulator [Kiloniellales bacterium]
MASTENRGISIFLRILFVFMMVNIATSSILIFLAYNFSHDSTERRTKETIAQQIDTIHQIFDHQLITDLNRSLSTVAASSALDDYLQASMVERVVAQKKLERMFLQLVRDFEEFQGASFINGDGDVMIEVAGSARRRESINLETESPVSTGITDPAAFEATARLFMRLKAIPVLLSSGNMEWFMPPREMAISSPFIDQDGTISFVAGLAKIDLDTGTFGGIVAIRHSLDDFLDGLRSVTFLNENPIWVFDENGKTLQSPENEDASFDPRSHFADGFQGSLAIARVDAGIVAYQDFAISPGTPFLRVAVAIPTTLLLKDFAPAVRFFTAVLIASLMVVLAVAFYVSRYLSKPIVELASAASRLAGGDLETRVKVRTTGEVQVLVDSFNRMTERLRDSIASRDESLHSLEAEVAVRTRAEVQLKRQAEEITKARIAAEDASRAKSSFLARMSHEIRTPMIGVLGMTDLLGRTELAERQHRLVGILRQSAETLLSIINDILDFSRIEAGKLVLDRIEFELRELVADVAELLAEPAQSKALEIVYALDEAVPEWVVGDPHRLRQVLMNLIGNAIKFTEEGEVEVKVALEGTAEDGVVLMFRVRDTGIGIDLDKRTDLFEAFEQADGSISRRYGGTGLGLSIARQLVAMMGGQMGVESETGGGSTFWFTVTLGRGCEEPAARSGRLFDLSGARILVVDDNATNREVLCQYLGNSGAACLEADNAVKALAILNDEDFDVAILDVAMPEIDGVELARRIASSADIAETPLVLLTSIGGEESRELAQGLEVAGFLTKPVRPKELCQQVARVLRRPDAAADDQSAIAAGSAGSGAAPALQASVLLAEDNPVNQEVAREYLEALGCRVDVVETGAAALLAYEAGAPDLILMDCQMPEMGGLEATRWIRDLEQCDEGRARIPIIAVTAFTVEGERDRCRAAGMDDYLAKPFDQEALLDVLKRWLPKLQLDGGAAAAADSDRVLAEVHGEVLDQGALDKIRRVGEATGRDVLSRVIEIYLENTTKELDNLSAAIERADGTAVAQLAHRLKSSSGNLGAQRLVERFRRLERSGREDTLGDASKLLAEIRGEFKKAKRALQAELQGPDQLPESA